MSEWQRCPVCDGCGVVNRPAGVDSEPMSAAWWWAWAFTTVVGVLWDIHATDAARGGSEGAET